jgi:hypothetical protein
LKLKCVALWFYVVVLMYHEKLKVQLGVANGQW